MNTLNSFFKATHLPWFTLAAGILGGIVRAWLYATGVDSKGLLASDHPGQILIWLLTGVVIVLLLLGTKDLQQAPKYGFNFPAQPVSAAGAALAALGILIASIREMLAPGDSFFAIDILLGILSAAALGFLSHCRLKGRHPTVIFHALICVYLMVHLICQYRLWSADPQIQNYCFSLLSAVCIMLSNFYSAAFDANEGRRRPHAFFHLASVYFCMVSAPHCEDPLFYLSMALWMFTDICNLTPMPRGER